MAGALVDLRHLGLGAGDRALGARDGFGERLDRDELTLEVADAGAQPRFGVRFSTEQLGFALLQALLEPFDRLLALLRVPARDRAIEHEPADLTFVDRRFDRYRDACLAAQFRVQRLEGRTDVGFGQLHLDGVMAEIGAHAGIRGFEARERAQARQLTDGIGEERVVVRDDPAFRRHQFDDRRVVPLPQGEPERVRVLVAALQGERDLERVPQADDEQQLGFEIHPVRRGEARCAGP